MIMFVSDDIIIQGGVVMEGRIKMLLKYQQMYGKRGNESYGRWITKKRTVNSACYIADKLLGMDFARFESVLCFKCGDNRMGYFIKVYGSQLEEAALEPERFIRGLDQFLLDTCLYIEKNRLFRDYFDFFMLLEKQHITNTYGAGKDVFDAYISLLMQQTSYFCRDRTDEQVTGVRSDGSLMFGKQLFPYSDAGAYEMEERFGDGKKPVVISGDDIRKIYRQYGYDIGSLEQAAFFEEMVRLHENSVFFMAPFVSARTSSLVPGEAFAGVVGRLPRQWKPTEVYRERLLDRNYMLPRSGITALYKNAGSIEKILFYETICFNEVVLLFKIIMCGGGECPGFYWTKSQLFFAGSGDGGRSVENFVLENYFVLSCNYEIDRKKNFALKQTENLEKEFHYPEQPLVFYSYKKAAGKKGSGHCRYVKEVYDEEMRRKGGYVRKLPEGQRASAAAVQAAGAFGISLPEGRTFVRPHNCCVRVKKKGDITR